MLARSVDVQRCHGEVHPGCACAKSLDRPRNEETAEPAAAGSHDAALRLLPGEPSGVRPGESEAIGGREESAPAARLVRPRGSSLLAKESIAGHTSASHRVFPSIRASDSAAGKGKARSLGGAPSGGKAPSGLRGTIAAAQAPLAAQAAVQQLSTLRGSVVGESSANLPAPTAVDGGGSLGGDETALRRRQAALGFRTDVGRQIDALVAGSSEAITRLGADAEGRKEAVRADKEARIAELKGAVAARRAGVNSDTATHAAAAAAAVQTQLAAVQTARTNERQTSAASTASIRSDLTNHGHAQAGSISSAGEGEANRARAEIGAQIAELQSLAAGAAGQYGGGEKGAAQGEAARRAGAQATGAVGAPAAGLAAQAQSGANAAAGELLDATSQVAGTIAQGLGPLTDALAGVADEALGGLAALGEAAQTGIAEIGASVLGRLDALEEEQVRAAERAAAAAVAELDQGTKLGIERLAQATSTNVAKTKATAEEIATHIESAESVDPDEIDALLARVRAETPALVAQELAALATKSGEILAALDGIAGEIGQWFGGLVAGATGLIEELLALGRGALGSLLDEGQARATAGGTGAAGVLAGMGNAFRAESANAAASAAARFGGVAGEARGDLANAVGTGVQRNRAEVAAPAAGKMDQAAGRVGADFERSVADRVLDALGNLIGGAFNAAASIGSAVAQATIAPLVSLAGPALQAFGGHVRSLLAGVVAEARGLGVGLGFDAGKRGEMGAGLGAAAAALYALARAIDLKGVDPKATVWAPPNPIIIIIGLALIALFTLLYPLLRDLLKDLVRRLPRTREKEARHACPDSVNLPSGVIEATLIPGMGQFFTSFSMEIAFRTDNTGCDAVCGEYKQEIRGFAQRDKGTGVMAPADPPGLPLDPGIFKEDLRGGILPYGVRAMGSNTDKDRFLPNRLTGPLYKGADDPGFIGVKPNEQLHFHFEFHGTPVNSNLNGCPGRGVPAGPTRQWIVRGRVPPGPTGIPVPPVPPIPPIPIPTGPPKRDDEGT
jgi:hypothetical protein